jgi:predicted PurR-regulated permease PerM
MSAEPTTPLLSASQRRIAGFALTLLALLGSAALLIVAVMVLGRLVGFFSGVLWPLAVAGVLALILRPVVGVFERLGLRRVSAVVLLYALFLLLVTGALTILMPPLIGQLIDFVAYLPDFWANASGYLQQHYAQWVALAQRQLENPTVRQFADQVTAESQALLAQALPSLRSAGSGLLGLAAFSAHAAIVPVYLFFFLLARGGSAKSLAGHLPFLKPGVRDDLVFLVQEFVGIVEAFFRGQLLIGLIMGALLALGFTLVGLKFALFVGLLIGVLNIVPYLGTIIGLGVALPLAFFQADGGWRLLALVVLVKVVVQAIEGWVLTPKIMGHQTGLHPVAIIVAVFFWGTAFGGVLGMLLAVPLTAFVVTAWRLARQKYFTAPDA